MISCDFFHKKIMKIHKKIMKIHKKIMRNRPERPDF